MMNRIGALEHMFIAREAALDPDFSPMESIEVEVVSKSRFTEMISRGEFEQLPSLGMLLLAQMKTGESFVDLRSNRDA